MTHALVVSNLRAMGFVRALADGAPLDLSGPDAEDAGALGADVTHADELLIVVDRLKAEKKAAERIADSLGTCTVPGRSAQSAEPRTRPKLPIWAPILRNFGRDHP